MIRHRYQLLPWPMARKPQARDESSGQGVAKVENSLEERNIVFVCSVVFAVFICLDRICLPLSAWLQHIHFLVLVFSFCGL